MEFQESLTKLFTELQSQGFEDTIGLVEQGTSASTLEQLAAYLDLLIRWRTKVDLVSDAPRDELFRRHILDAIAALYVTQNVFHRSFGRRFSVSLDIGSGAGLPGVVWALLDPSMRTFLLEPRGRRVQFLKEVKRSLNLANVEVVKSSMENVSRETFSSIVEDPTCAIEVCVARALGKEEHYFRECSGFLGSTGLASIMVGPSWEESKFSPHSGELTAYSFLGGEAHRAIASVSFAQ